MPEVECGPSISDQIKLWQKREVDKVLCNTTAPPLETRRLLKEIDTKVRQKQAAAEHLLTKLINLKIASYENPEEDPSFGSALLDKQPQE